MKKCREIRYKVKIMKNLYRMIMEKVDIDTCQINLFTFVIVYIRETSTNNYGTSVLHTFNITFSTEFKFLNSC